MGLSFFFKFGNTCYVNSVLQALYFCKPFREKIIEYKLGYNQRTAHLNSKENSSSSSSHQTAASTDVSSNYQFQNGHSQSNGLLANGMTTMQNGIGSNTSPNSTSAAAVATTNGNASSSNNSNNSNVNILKQEHLLNCLAELFYSISNMKKKKGIVQPKKFIARLRKDNGRFDCLVLFN